MAKKAQVDPSVPPKVAAAFSQLEPKERKFVAAYCGEARGNGSLAVQVAGLSNGKLSVRNSASVRMLRKPEVRTAIDAWMQAFGMTASEITSRIADLTEVNPGPFFEINKNGKLVLKEKIDPKEWEAHKHWVKSVRTDDTGNVIALELHNAMEAYRELAKINKLYSDAPIFIFHQHLQAMSDDELLRQLEEARREESTQLPTHRMPQLTGGPVTVQG